MIFILSIDGDTSTDFVISWLKEFNYPYKRLNAYDLVTKEFFFDLSNENLKIDNEIIDFKKIFSIWHRKSRFYRDSEHYSYVKKHIDPETAHHLSTEFFTIYDGIINLLEGKNWLTHPRYSSPNKIKVLRIAQSLGLKIPDSYIVSSKNKLSQLSEKENLIAKSVFNPRPIESNSAAYTMFTSRIGEKELYELPNNFFPSLVQAEIRKQYEIRTFFLTGSFYSMAMFSQESTKTEVDFRNYDWDEPIRQVPYQLPVDIETKLLKLLSKLNINCASIDLIKGVDNQYYFLEINTNGQFGMVDFPCNYGLHRKVAETLIKLDN